MRMLKPGSLWARDARLKEPHAAHFLNACTRSQCVARRAGLSAGAAARAQHAVSRGHVVSSHRQNDCRQGRGEIWLVVYQRRLDIRRLLRGIAREQA
jgi:hypothetical protein